jgi:hypothetical protein
VTSSIFEQTISAQGESLLFGIQCLSVAHAMDVDGNGCMPAFSDPPYPFDCPIGGLTSSFERYQRLTNKGSYANFLIRHWRDFWTLDGGKENPVLLEGRSHEQTFPDGAFVHPVAGYYFRVPNHLLCFLGKAGKGKEASA